LATDEPKDDLALVVEETREGVIRSARKVQELLKKMEDNLDGLTSKGARDPRGLQQAMTAYGIMVDKVPVLLRTLRNLEAEAVDDIEAYWEPVIKED
jgi:hypothetical protein